VATCLITFFRRLPVLCGVKSGSVTLKLEVWLGQAVEAYMRVVSRIELAKVAMQTRFA
jgi:hypothetical protein